MPHRARASYRNCATYAFALPGEPVKHFVLWMPALVLDVTEDVLLALLCARSQLKGHLRC
eukprot:2422791-Pleurochrysis_carterae.AAC.1